jgi:hypothetical protein
MLILGAVLFISARMIGIFVSPQGAGGPAD